MVYHLHISIDNLNNLYMYMPADASVTGFLQNYSQYLNGYIHGLTTDIDYIYSLFRFPEDKNNWITVPLELPNTKTLNLCVVNFNLDSMYLAKTGEIVISDWSQAGFAPASYDIANLFYSLKLNEALQDIFYDTYNETSLIKRKGLKSEVNTFISILKIKSAIELLSGTHRSVNSFDLTKPDSELTAQLIHEAMCEAFDVWNIPRDNMLEKRSMLAVIRKWIREAGPGPNAWIPSVESLDEFLSKNMS